MLKRPTVSLEFKKYRLPQKSFLAERTIEPLKQSEITRGVLSQIKIYNEEKQSQSLERVVAEKQKMSASTYGFRPMPSHLLSSEARKYLSDDIKHLYSFSAK